MLGFLSADDHPVALLPRSTTRYRVFDPVTRQTRDVSEDVAKDIKEFAWGFYRSFPLRQIKVRDVIHFAVQGCRADIATIAMMGIATGIMAILTPILPVRS